ncbi:MAG: T9SS type A sorting domain-containing protein, partial [Chitinophagales bacterium]
YKADQQPDPTELNMTEGYTAIQLMDGALFKFNQDIILYSTNDFNEYEDVQFINRKNYTAGTDGAFVVNAFNKIDQQLIFSEARIKSNYLIKEISAIDPSKKFLVIEDAFILPDGFKLVYDKYEGSNNEYGFWYGDLILENNNGIELARIEAPVMYDSNPLATVYQNEIRQNSISYVIEQSGNICVLKMIIESAWLASPNRIYPITIDPTVYGATATWTGVQGTDYTPVFCSTTLSVPTPPLASFTGSSVYWEFVASGFACSPFCKMSFMEIRINTLCGNSPNDLGVWVCYPCNTAGTWSPTLDDATTAALVSCAAANCSSSIDFNILHNQYQCNTPGGCVTTCDYLQKFEVTIEGETGYGLEVCNGFDDDCDAIIDEDIVEMASVSAGGPTTFCQGGNVLLTATYTGATIQWKKDGVNILGATSSTYSAATKGSYTCATISPCGAAISNSILVNVLKNPPASITAGGATTFCTGGSVVLTANAGAGLSYQWYKGATAIGGATSINYTATATGNYKCRVTKTATGCFKNSNAISVSVPCKEGEEISASFNIYPNPSSGIFTISVELNDRADPVTLFQIFNQPGELIYSKEINSANGKINEVIEIKNISSGVYLVKMLNKDIQFEEN